MPFLAALFLPPFLLLATLTYPFRRGAGHHRPKGAVRSTPDPRRVGG